MATKILIILLVASARIAVCPQNMMAQETRVSEDSAGVTIDFVDTDLRAAVQALSAYLDRPIIVGNLPNHSVTLQTPAPVPRADVVGLLRNLLATQSYEMVVENGAYVIRASHPTPPPAPVRRATRSTEPEATELFVIRLRHARAEDVAQVVSALYGHGSALGELGARPRGTLSDDLRNNRIPPAGEPSAPVGQATPRRTGGFEGEVEIIPDARTNALLIRATRGDFELIQQAVSKLDVRPMQVLIQATIAEVRSNSALSAGLSATLHPHSIGGGGTVGGSTQGVGATDLSANVLGLDVGGAQLDLALTAGESRGTVTILSRPLIFAANNQEAEISVGDQLPFVQVQRSTSGGVLDNVVQYKDVSTRLSVVPTISDDGYVQLVVTQEINNATGTRGVQNAPELSTRSVKTTLLVRDGQTAVLGGLASQQRDRASSGVPFLSRIPLLGALFGGRSHSSDDEELFVFLTPRVIRSDAELRSATETVQRNGGEAAKLPATARSLVRDESAPADSSSPSPLGSDSLAPADSTQRSSGCFRTAEPASQPSIAIAPSAGTYGSAELEVDITWPAGCSSGHLVRTVTLDGGKDLLERLKTDASGRESTGRVVLAQGANVLVASICDHGGRCIRAESKYTYHQGNRF